MDLQSLLILAVVGLVGVWAGRKLAEKRLGAKPDSLIEKQESEKAKNIRKLIEFFQENDRVTNNDVENLLDVSDATATNYLQELEDEDIIKQHGETGRYVYYTFNG